MLATAAWNSGCADMDLTDKRYTDLISAFDNWGDFASICITLTHLGLECAESREDYEQQIKTLILAKHKYPQLPLHEAFRQVTTDAPEHTIIHIVEHQRVPSIPPEPCGTCGGGKVL